MRCDSCPGKGILEPVPISTEIDKKQENSGYSLINTKHVMALIVALFCVYIVYDIIKQKITFVKGYETKIVFLYDNDAFRDTHLNEVKDINEYTQNGWEIKSSRRATGLYNSAGTEYTLQKPIYGP